MTERELVERAIARCEAKLALASDELSRYYYRCCLVGWKEHLKRLEEI